LGVIQVTHGGRGGKLIAVAPVSHVVAGLERADVHGIGIRTIHGREHAAHAKLALTGAALLMHGSPSGQDLASAAIPSQTLLTESPWSRSSPMGESVAATHDAPQPLPALAIDLLLTPKDSQDQDLLEEFSQLPNLDEDVSLADLLFPAIGRNERSSSPATIDSLTNPVPASPARGERLPSPIPEGPHRSAH
jgi:hypothetical protein